MLQTTDHRTKTVTRDPVKTLNLQILAAKIDQETILNHHLDIIYNIQIYIIITKEVAHLNIKDK